MLKIVENLWTVGGSSERSAKPLSWWRGGGCIKQLQNSTPLSAFGPLVLPAMKNYVHALALIINFMIYDLQLLIEDFVRPNRELDK